MAIVIVLLGGKDIWKLGMLVRLVLELVCPFRKRNE